MLRSVIGSVVKLRLVVVALAAALVAIGVARLHSMPVDALPEYAPPTVEVQTEALGLSAPEVETLVTLNLEELLNGTPRLETITSKSVPGLSDILLLFEPGTDILRARQLVQERLTLAFAIPNVATPPVILQPRSATNRVMMVGLSSKTVSPIQMGVLARWTVRPALLSVDGVANVSIWGQQERQLQVQVDPEHLKEADISLDQIVKTTGNAMWVSPLTFLQASTPGTGGWIDTPQQRLEVRHVFPISTASDLAKVRVENASMRLGDVATVVENHQPLIGDAVVKDDPDLLLVIEKFPGANTLRVTRDLERRFDELQAGLAGVQVDTTVLRPADYVESSMRNLLIWFGIGAVLAIVALGLLLWDWRAALVGAAAMAVSLMAAAIVLDLRGQTVNAMVVAGLVIALAVVVHDAVTSLDYVRRGLRDADAGDEGTAIARAASLQAGRAMGFGVVIALVPLLALVAVDGVAGALLRPLTLSYALAVLASVLVAVTLTPALGMIVLRGTAGRPHESPLVRRLERGYAAALDRAFARPSAAFAAAGLLTLAGLVAAPFLGRAVMPQFKDSDIEVRFDGPPGVSQPEMARITNRARVELASLPGVANVGAHVGRAILGDRTVDANAGELWATVDSNADYDRTVAAIRDVVDGYPGLDRNVEPYVSQRLDTIRAGASDPITVHVFGPNFGVLRRTADRVGEALSHVDGVARVNVEHPVVEPEVEIEVDLARAHRYGLKPGDVRREAATLLAGLEVGSLFQEQKVFQVVVWTTPTTRTSLSSIRDLLIDTPRGGHVRLGDVANVRIAPSPTVIEREEVSRRLLIGLEVRGRDVGAVTDDVRSTIAGMQFPLEYHAEVAAEYRDRQIAQREGIGVAVAAAILIYLLLHAALGSWRLAALLYLTLPAALAGGALGAFAAGDDLSLPSAAGFLAVLAIAARNGILLVVRMESAGFERWSRHEAAIRGARERLAPTLTSTLVVALALVPVLVRGSIAGLEVAHPIVVVVIAGLVTAALVDLFVLPALYMRFGPDPRAADTSAVAA
jgi:Cu/Ag efflux pump CusA